MGSEITKTESNEQTKAEHYGQQPATQWKEMFRRAWQEFTPQHLSNLIFVIVAFLLSPLAGIIMKSTKLAIVGITLAITIVLWMSREAIVETVLAAARQR